MTAGFDKLIDYLLSEIALCGVQGAGSADLRRFIKSFYDQSQTDEASPTSSKQASGPPPGGLGRTFHERVWDWVSNHTDIRITYKNEVKHYSLSEFEAAELQVSGATGAVSSIDVEQLPPTPINGPTQPTQPLLAMREALRERLLKEGHKLGKPTALATQAPTSTSRQFPRTIPEGTPVATPIFDEPDPTITTPRLYASQNRIWQALTGHSIDLKKVPSMEFVLLSLIAARGPNGITQPDLTQLSGQDKRSVPHRTNELARKGYIVKNPVQAGKIRTSLCVHTKFISQSHFLSSGAVEDVFQEGTFLLSGFVHLLYRTLKDDGIVPTRDIRKKLGVPMTTWNKRATQGALIRLDQTGMIKRFRVRKKHSEDSWATCIQVLREPRDEDVNNLGFRRQPTTIDETVDELLDEDVDGDTLMRDLEVDMLDNAHGEGDVNAEPRHAIEDSGRIPPQWTPDRFFANIIYDAVALGGANGVDASMLRDRIIGPFWRRPIESYVTRLTDDWEKTQPLPLRHLAIIRDSRNTEEKKFIHYVYRTYENFQKAVDLGEVHWEGVSKPITKETGAAKHGGSKKNNTKDVALNAWGFPNLNLKDLVRSDGSATLSEVRLAIVHPRKYGPRWDNALTREIGYEKSETPITKKKFPRAKPIRQNQGDGEGSSQPSVRVPKISKSKRKVANLCLTLEQRVFLGLKPTGRLSKRAEKQILAHRRNTGDPESLPDKITEEPVQRGQPPLMTAEERVAQGLPAKGRLGLARENKIREERGLVKLAKKTTTKREKKPVKEPALLSKEQRLAFGWKGHGRLPQDLIDGLRQEREDGISLEDSNVLPKYMDMMKAKAGTLAASETADSVENEATILEQPSSSIGDVGHDQAPEPTDDDIDRASSLPTVLGKREAHDEDPVSQSQKKQRTTDESQQGTRTRVTHPAALLNEAAASMTILSDSRSGTPLAVMDDEDPMEGTTPTPIRVVENTQGTSHPSHAPAGSKMAKSVGVQQSPAPLANTHAKTLFPLSRPSVLVQPVASNLEPQARAKFEQYTNRSASGLYLNPFARHKSRGRPKKALIATFKLPQLLEYEWFKHDPGHQQDPTHTTSKEVPVASPKHGIQQYLDNTDPRPMLGTKTSLQPHTMTSPTSGTDSNKLHAGQPDDINVNRHPSITNDSTLSTPVLPFVVNEDNAEKQVQPTPRALNASPEAQALSTALPDDTEELQEQRRQSPENLQFSSDLDKEVHDKHSLSQQLLAAATGNTVEASAEPPVQQVLPVSHPTAAWAAINASTSHKPSPYRSPYAPSSRSESTPPPQVTENATSTNFSAASASLPQTPLGDEREDNSFPEGVYSAILEVEAPPTAKLKSRGKKDQATGGSGLLFRRQIIREIIDLCKGVFPDGGEIGRPFHKLWTERHGHKENVKEPIASTVNTTMRNMCTNPKFGLKRMVFLVKNKHGPFTTERAMITYAHFTPRSPEVLQMAYKIANFSLEKSHQYFPDEISHLVDDTSLYYPVRVARKDESIVLNQLNPVKPELEAQIKQAQKRRRNDMARQKRLEDKARKAQNAQVEEAPSKKGPETDGIPHAKRARLASLNDKNKRYRRAPLQSSDIDPIDEAKEGQEIAKPHAVATLHSEVTPLISTHSWVAPIVGRYTPDDEEDESSEPEESDDESSDSPVGETQKDPANGHDPSFLLQIPEQLRPTNNATSAAEPTSKGTVQASVVSQKGNKRVRITDPSAERSQKKVRLNTAEAAISGNADVSYGSNAGSDTSAPFETEDDDEDDEEDVRPKEKRRRKTYGKRQTGKPGPLPTLLERLTGLTGDPNDPIYQLPTRKERQRTTTRPWNEKKNNTVNKKRKERNYTEILDPVDKFKKLCCTLVLASSMPGEDGSVDWGIVEKVYNTDKFFDITRTKKLWTWMQVNMDAQLTESTSIFQSSFLQAYADGKFAAIENPETYDWASIVQWAMRQHTYPEIPLPVYQEALRQFSVDESSYEVLDRLTWYQKKIADRVRTQLQLHYTFAARLHRSRRSDWSPSDTVLKARSWIRANTATPQAQYSGNQAHDKLMGLGTPVLASVVGDYVEKQNLRMRQIKRLLPGRNYTFTKAFAKKFVRPFELNDFMAAIKVKKDMDAAFAHQDPEKRFFNISRCEQDGSVTAILSMVSEGKVKLVPQLPPVNNEFGAPLPRLSVWGFCEGDYIHRAIDRNRLFWDTHVVPTANYQFGSPLQPLPLPLAPAETDEYVQWPSLPDPPLPGKHDPDALLPIWSTLDGQSITWPWWYRILNLVLQPLIFQPGATATDIYAHCPEHTTEIFEIELVLNWLESINAVSKIIGGGYVTKPSFWAAFGDKLLDTEEDWFGGHVKRKAKNHAKQQWREQYNLRHSTLQGRNLERVNNDSAEENGMQEPTHDPEEATREQILKNPKQQYRIMQQALKSRTPQAEDGADLPAAPIPVPLPVQFGQTGVEEEALASVSQTPEVAYTPIHDMDIIGADEDAMGEDIDAEGEVDDGMY
ncbi:uncharacterized protein K460DRAFT_363304 [Cucurbitaria berberidis CBS 394.84]|uniref:B-block binding subunit of TFIIIC domain-containing protein n=1 Tax=Cucurbitaria berberidis CBS 394.84 TaxID=1168544 RepID=A0A9P4GL21_9PLEO|nr:uncharacterized protein K460DRAFT_363304 [Cucurbitaria berberidis CBS 394.84]KAF1847197.1 hypothetical protein K460DRAFT_363304 [Cucurbitaria berberidis CBS 394.84]